MEKLQYPSLSEMVSEIKKENLGIEKQEEGERSRQLMIQAAELVKAHEVRKASLITMEGPGFRIDKDVIHSETPVMKFVTKDAEEASIRIVEELIRKR